MSESDHLSYPGSHSSIIARRSQWPTSAPELVATTSDKGSPKASSQENKDTLELPAVVRASQAITRDVLPQLPLPYVTDIATTSPSQKLFDAEYADPHDIV